MSRAFVRDPEPGEPRCPACGGLGEAVNPATLEAQAPPEKRPALGHAAFWCGSADCALGYFTAWGASVPAAELKGKAWPKDPTAPICPCTGLTADDVIADAKAGRKERVKALLGTSTGPEARCAERCPDGLPCIPRVFRLFREHFDASAGT